MREICGARLGYIPQQPHEALHPMLTIERQFRDAVQVHEKRGCSARKRLGR